MISINKILPPNSHIIPSRLVQQTPKNYELLSRCENLPVRKLDDIESLFIKKDNVVSYTKVLIGKISDAFYNKEIKTFYDNSKRIILRIFKQNGNPERIHYYQYGSKNDRYISSYKPVTANISKTNPKLKDFHLVSKEYLRVFELHSHKYNCEPYPRRVSRKIVEYSNNGDNKVQKITFLRTPFNLGLGKPSDKKILIGKIIKTGNNYILDDVSKTDNFNLDMQDKYLNVRFLDPRSSDGLCALTRQLLQEKNLDKLNISIQTNHTFIDNSEGSFSAILRQILYKDFSKEAFPEQAVDCAAHEVDHALRYAQIGRLGKGCTSYETDALNQLGEITKLEEIKEAVKCSVAKDEYPASNKRWNNPNYRDNYLEQKAVEAGEKAAEEFESSKNYDFFEEFMPVEP